MSVYTIIRIILSVKQIEISHRQDYLDGEQQKLLIMSSAEYGFKDKQASKLFCNSNK